MTQRCFFPQEPPRWGSAWACDDAEERVGPRHQVTPLSWGVEDEAHDLSVGRGGLKLSGTFAKDYGIDVLHGLRDNKQSIILHICIYI